MNSKTHLLYLFTVLLTSACTEDESDRPPEAGAEDVERLPGVPDLGVGASLNGKPTFTTTNDPTKMGFEWTKDVSQSQVDPQSTTLLVNGMGLASAAALSSVPLHPDFGTTYQGAPIGISSQIVPGDQPRLPISFFGAPSESDPGPYPFPPNVPIEGGAGSTGDRHVIVIDRDNWKLYEAYDTHPVTQNGQVVGFQAYSGAIFDLSTGAYRPRCWTSADAAGTPIFAGLARYDEAVQQGAITHALRFTLRNTRRAFIKPATHFASTNANASYPPMGTRIRLKASYLIDDRFTPEVKVVLQALKKYGLILSDNGSNLYVTGTNDSRWNDASLATMKTVKASDFEVVKLDPGQIMTSCP